MNKAILVGRLTKDPELKNTPSGVMVCGFVVACDRKHAQNGERQTDFINCVAWRQQAEFIARYFKKGERIALEGTIQTRSWNDNQGYKRYVTEIVVESVEFAQSKSETAPASPAPTVPTPAEPQEQTDEGYNEFSAAYLGEDLPF